MVLPEFRHRGAARMMVAWGCQVSDNIDIPVLVEGLSEIQDWKLWRKPGFTPALKWENDESIVCHNTVCLRRDPRPLARSGGKSVKPGASDAAGPSAPTEQPVATAEASQVLISGAQQSPESCPCGRRLECRVAPRNDWKSVANLRLGVRSCHKY